MMRKDKINFLRDLRKLDQIKWLKPDDYILFLQRYPELEKIAYDNKRLIKEELGLTPEQFLQQFSKERPATNFNPGNILNKPRYKWTPSQYARLNAVRGL